MKLQRKWARVVTAFIVAAALLVLAADVMLELMPDIMSSKETARYRQVQTALMFSSLASIVGAIIVLRKHLCCSHCRAMSVNPWQKRGTVRYCSQCGAALSFDDGERK